MHAGGQTLCVTPKLLVPLKFAVTMRVRKIQNCPNIRTDMSNSFPAEAALIFDWHMGCSF
jgi:hypothetical protein